ncbi:MAG: Dyp-type peroxidase [Polyangiales bacterium]
MSSLPCQPAILAPGAIAARYLSFRLLPDVNPRETLVNLASAINGIDTVVGIGSSTLARLGSRIEGLHEVPAFDGALEPIPSTPRALWLWLRGEDRGELLHRGIRLTAQLQAAFALESVLDGFRFAGGRDLSDYEDGTENPKGDAAAEAALLESDTPGLAGSSFVAVQRWQHELERFQRFAPAEQDAIIGRRRSDNEELSDAPASAHVKRTAQESFDPAAFMLRRSLPWIDGHAHGLEFVAFGRSFYAFEAQLRRMIGLEDGIVDGLFRFSRPTATSYYWCPPVTNGHLDLRALGV